MSDPPASTDTPRLSVVVVTYNEADRIGDCLESLLSLSLPPDEMEVIVVDGDSTDETVSIAGSYPVTVLRTPQGVLSTPASGRHVGTEYASGEYILFVDGDTRVAEGWVETAIDRMAGDSELAGVGGYFNEVGDAPTTETVESLWRTVLYEREPLTEVEGFDPYLNSLEDIDVGFRLRRAGYRLEKLGTVVGYHPDQEGIDERFRRWERGFYYGNGEILKKYLDSPTTLIAWLTRFSLWAVFVGWAGVGALAVRRGDGRPYGVLSVALLAIALYKRDWYWVQRRLIGSFVFLPLGTIRGFYQYPRQPPAFPFEHVVVESIPADGEAYNETQ